MRVDSHLGRRAIIAVHAALAIGFGITFVRNVLTPTGIVATDFTVFWTGWWLILHGHAQALYDAAAQLEVQQSLMGGMHFQGGLMAFLNPPHAALAGTPFGWLADHAGERIAFLVWTALNLALLIALDRWLREELGATAGSARWVMTSALVGFYPVFQTINIGQTSLLLAVAALGLHRAVKGSRPLAGATWLLALTIKPQMVPPVLVFLIARRSWRLLGYSTAMLALAGAITAWVLRPTIWLEYASHLGTLEHFFGSGTPVHMLNLRGTLTRAFGASAQPAIDTVAYALWIAATLLVGVLFAYRRIHETQDTRPAYTLAVAVALLASPHLFVQDVVVWAVPLVLYTAALRDAGAGWQPFARFALAWPMLFALVRLVYLDAGQNPTHWLDLEVMAFVVATVVIERGTRIAQSHCGLRSLT